MTVSTCQQQPLASPWEGQSLRHPNLNCRGFSLGLQSYAFSLTAQTWHSSRPDRQLSQRGAAPHPFSVQLLWVWCPGSLGWGVLCRVALPGGLHLWLQACCQGSSSTDSGQGSRAGWVT